jgi:hypothetical protein
MTTISKEGPLEAPDKEAAVQRNPHEDFASIQASRAPYNHSDTWQYLKTPNPEWKIGNGAHNEEWKKHEKLAIDPNDPRRQCEILLMLGGTQGDWS